MNEDLSDEQLHLATAKAYLAAVRFTIILVTGSLIVGAVYLILTHFRAYLEALAYTVGGVAVLVAIAKLYIIAEAKVDEDNHKRTKYRVKHAYTDELESYNRLPEGDPMRAQRPAIQYSYVEARAIGDAIDKVNAMIARPIVIISVEPMRDGEGWGERAMGGTVPPPVKESIREGRRT